MQEDRSALQGKVFDLEKVISDLQDKQQASKSYAEELEQTVVKAEAEKDGYQQKTSEANDLIMQHLHRQVCLCIMVTMINILAIWMCCSTTTLAVTCGTMNTLVNFHISLL